MSDPYQVQETLCEGPFNVQFGRGMATITFTHIRPKAKKLLEEKKVEYETIVQARIVFSTRSLLALKKVLNDLIKDEEPGEAAAGAPIH